MGFLAWLALEARAGWEGLFGDTKEYVFEAEALVACAVNWIKKTFAQP